MSPPGPAPIDVADLRRREFPHLSDSAYLNAASVGPIPARSRRALDAQLDARARIHTFGEAQIVEALTAARDTAARLVGARPEEIALGTNTSFGINVAALSLPVEPGTRAITSDREFPANVYPWMARERFDFEIVPTDSRGWPDEDALLTRLDEGDVSILALSAVQFASGHRADLARIGRACRDRGVHFVVDAIQALGQVPIDVDAMCIDVLASGGHKWLLAPFGTGFLYVREALIERMQPRFVGWSSMEASADLAALLDYAHDPVDDARRFETGSLPFHDLAAFGASMGLILEVGVDRIERHLVDLLEPLERWLASHDGFELLSPVTAARSGIQVFRTPDSQATFARLTDAGVVASLREGAIRLAPHLYNDDADIARVLNVLDEEC